MQFICVCDDVIWVYNTCSCRAKKLTPPDTTPINHIIAHGGQNLIKYGY